MSKYIFGLILLFSIQEGVAQPGSDTIQIHPGIKNAIALYHNVAGFQSPLYNGIKHEGYRFDIKGHAYFQTREWQLGSVVYENIFYQNIPMLYDEFKDQLIINHPESNSAISLISERIAGFNLAENRFIYIAANNDLKVSGFYHVLYTGTVSLLAKREKYIQENVNQLVIDRSFETSYQYLIKKKNGYHRMKNIKSLFDVFEDREKEIRLFVKRNNLNFKLDPDGTLIKVAAYYDQLTGS